jgi:hypothetical protein
MVFLLEKTGDDRSDSIMVFYCTGARYGHGRLFCILEGEVMLGVAT